MRTSRVIQKMRRRVQLLQSVIKADSTPELQEAKLPRRREKVRKDLLPERASFRPQVVIREINFIILLFPAAKSDSEDDDEEEDDSESDGEEEEDGDVSSKSSDHHYPSRSTRQTRNRAARDRTRAGET